VSDASSSRLEGHASTQIFAPFSRQALSRWDPGPSSNTESGDEVP